MLLTELSYVVENALHVHQHLNIYLFRNEKYFGILLSGKQYCAEYESVGSECRLLEFNFHMSR